MHLEMRGDGKSNQAGVEATTHGRSQDGRRTPEGDSGKHTIRLSVRTYT